MIDLMAALESSVRQAKVARGEDAADSGADVKPLRKGPARKASPVYVRQEADGEEDGREENDG